MMPVWRDAHHEVGGFIEARERVRLRLVPTVMAWATPAGPVDRRVLRRHHRRARRPGAGWPTADGVLLALHGAMVTPKHPDADAEVLRRVRGRARAGRAARGDARLPRQRLPAMAETRDVLVGYQTYPHVDQRERGLLAAELLARAVRGEIRPVRRVAKPPMLLNLLGQETDREPMAS